MRKVENFHCLLCKNSTLRHKFPLHFLSSQKWVFGKYLSTEEYESPKLFLMHITRPFWLVPLSNIQSGTFSLFGGMLIKILYLHETLVWYWIGYNISFAFQSNTNTITLLLFVNHIFCENHLHWESQNIPCLGRTIWAKRKFHC